MKHKPILFLGAAIVGGALAEVAARRLELARVAATAAEVARNVLGFNESKPDNQGTNAIE